MRQHKESPITLSAAPVEEVDEQSCEEFDDGYMPAWRLGDLDALKAAVDGLARSVGRAQEVVRPGLVAQYRAEHVGRDALLVVELAEQFLERLPEAARRSAKWRFAALPERCFGVVRNPPAGEGDA